jgi:hypothetical protein
MKRYQVTVLPQSSLFLGRDRGNRAVRHSFHHIPATTIGGALNTRFHQLGWKGLVGSVRFGNLYPAIKKDAEDVWLPAPRNLYYCPACHQGHLVTDFRPESALSERICARGDCGTPLRPEQGVVAARLGGARFAVDPDRRAAAPPSVNAQVVGRTELHRTTGAHVDGRLHQVELLRVQGHPFRGDVWVAGAATEVIHPGATFRLTIGGLRSRGCGHAELHIDDEIDNASTERVALLVETPVLPLPDDVVGEEEGEAMTFGATVATPYAQMTVNERWAAKPLTSGKGLVSFLDTLTAGSTIAAQEVPVLDEVMYFYRPRPGGSEWVLHGFDRARCKGREYNADYSFLDLWTLGYGRLRELHSRIGNV